MVGYVMLECSK